MRSSYNVFSVLYLETIYDDLKREKMATLTISHYIYINREQRYALHAGESLEVVGISVPVWFHKGTTSEPAKEIFCKYKITNEAENRAIIPTEEGFNINLPQKMDQDKDDTSEETKKAVALRLGTSENLLDYKDGGKEWLEFRQYNKVRQGENEFNVVHFVEIKPDEILSDTIN